MPLSGVRGKKEFYFDIEASIEKLRDCEISQKSLRLIGFPAFVLKLTEEYKKRFGSYPKINPVSFVITGGGWKTLANEAIDKKIYRKILATTLGFHRKMSEIFSVWLSMEFHMWIASLEIFIYQYMEKLFQGIPYRLNLCLLAKLGFFSL